MQSKRAVSQKMKCIFHVSLLALFITPVLPQPLKIAVISVFVIVCLFAFLKFKPAFKWQFFVLNASLYIVYLISLSYSSNLNYALSKLEVSASLIVFPFAFALIPVDILNYSLERVRHLFAAYIVSILVLNISLIVYYLFHFDGSVLSVEFSNYLNNFNSNYIVHPLYLSMHNAVALLLVIYLLRTERFMKSGIALFLVGCCLAVGLIVLMKKGPVFAFFIVATFLCLKYNLKRIWAFYFVLVASFGLSFAIMPQTLESFNELLKVEKVETDKNSSQIQVSVLQCVRENVDKTGFWGFGIGDAHDAQIACYRVMGSDLAKGSYNTHNQYLSMLLMTGFFGLFVFILFLAHNINNTIKSGVFITIAIILFYALVMFSENILERQEGVLYFSILLNLLFFLDKSNQQKVKVKKKPKDSLTAIIDNRPA